MQDLKQSVKSNVLTPTAPGSALMRRNRQGSDSQRRPAKRNPRGRPSPEPGRQEPGRQIDDYA